MTETSETNQADEDRLTRLKRLVSVLPETPGVYQYFDVKGTIIYVGKAVNLKRRVSQYFSRPNQSVKTAALVAHIEDIKHISVATETDALILENTLIKRHKPRYNILLKDDKTYPWIAILREPFPRVITTRQHRPGAAEYFGPYTSGTQLRELMEIVHTLFPLRQCNLDLRPQSIQKGKYAVCLKYHIGTCCGPCVGHVDEEEYGKHIASVRDILRGGVGQIMRGYTTAMNEASERLDYETAEQYKRKLQRLERYQSHSLLAAETRLDCEVFAVRQNEERGESYVTRVTVERGRVVQSRSHTYQWSLEMSACDVLQFALSCSVDEECELKPEIVTPVPLEPTPPGFKVTVPTSGVRKQLLDLAERNVRLYELESIKHRTERSGLGDAERRLTLIKEVLHLPVLPRHIECFDNSNTGGALPVASCVVYRDGRKSPKDYRLFKLSPGNGADDYASMREVVMRRYSRLQCEGRPLPDLVVADGGAGQMGIMREVARELGIELNIIGLAKNSRHATNQILIGDPPSVVQLDRSDTVFRFFAQMQLEVHRVAITFHRGRRSRSMTASLLDEAPGVGPRTKQLLFERFDSVEQMRDAPPEELSAVIGPARAKRLKEWLMQQLPQVPLDNDDIPDLPI